MHHATMSLLRAFLVGSFTFAAISASAPEAAAGCTNDKAALSLANEADGLRTTDVEAAIAKYEQAAALAPHQHRILYKLALAHVKREAWEEVARVTERALKLAPTFANYASMRGIALARVAARGGGSWAEAQSALRAALALDDGDADAHLELGDVLLHLDDERGALVHYDRAARLAPDRSAGYLSLGDLYLRMGFVPQAEKTLSEGMRLTNDKGKFALAMMLGRTAEARHESVLALTRYEEAKRTCGACTDPGEALVFFELGAAYATAAPPRKTEAIANLAAFSKLICKGAAASRYSGQCTQAYEWARRLGGAM